MCSCSFSRRSCAFSCSKLRKWFFSVRISAVTKKCSSALHVEEEEEAVEGMEAEDTGGEEKEENVVEEEEEEGDEGTADALRAAKDTGEA